MPRKNIIEPWHEISNNQQSPRSACAYAYAHSDQSLCSSLEYSMSVKLLTEHRLEFVSLKGGCTGSSESTLVRMPHCVAAQFMIFWLRADAYDTLGIFISHWKGKIQTSTTSLVFHASSAPFMLEFIVIGFFFHANPWKGDTARQLCLVC